MIVVDASAVIDALVGEPNERLAARLGAEAVWHAPHLLDTEVHHVFRRLEARRDLTRKQVETARANFLELTIDRYPHQPLSDRVWALRSVVTAYDATYLALAEALDATLVTTYGRLARAKGATAPIDAF